MLAVGKAAGRLARGVVTGHYGHLVRGLVVTRDEHDPGPEIFVARFAGHPIPDERSVEAGEAALCFAATVPAGETLAVLISGGASALLTVPIAGLDLSDLQAVTGALMKSGAAIADLNRVRSGLTQLAGGGLLAVAGTENVEVALVSDVPGDDPGIVGSGPCWPAQVSSDAVRLLLEGAAQPALVERVVAAMGDGDHRDRRLRKPPPHHIVARNADALAAIQAEARRQGIVCEQIAPLGGEAREEGVRLVRAATVAAVPRILVAGGETTVSVRGPGRGGRNQELALAAALQLEAEGSKTITLLAAGTDGIDGPTDAAGACVDGGTADRGRERGHDPSEALGQNDSYGFFLSEGGHIRTGPTGTNVMDVAIVGIGLESDR